MYSELAATRIAATGAVPGVISEAGVSGVLHNHTGKTVTEWETQ